MKKMKKLVMVSVLGIGLVLLGACGNKQFFDTTYTFNYAMVKLPDGTIKKCKVATWDDYEGEQLQIKFEDGTTVLVNSTNAVLSVDPIK